ncbi:MAG: winged helix-turn-helix transcriptional regulator [Solirubrobacterales bacterium]
MRRECLLGERRELVDQVLDRWSLPILGVLYEGPHRFSALRRQIPEVTQKSLAQALKRLERNGLVERRVLGTRPLAVEYAVTQLGRSFEAPLEALIRWSADNMEQVDVSRANYDARDGAADEMHAGLAAQRTDSFAPSSRS